MRGAEPVGDAITRILDNDRALDLLRRLHARRKEADSEALSLTVADAISELAIADENRPMSHFPPPERKTFRELLDEHWLPEMDCVGMLHYDAEDDLIVATPRTSLFWLVIKPGVAAHDREELEAEIGWLAWRDPNIAEAHDDPHVDGDG